MKILVAGGAGYVGSVLENNNLKSLRIDIMPHWEDGLRKYLKIIGAT